MSGIKFTPLYMNTKLHGHVAQADHFTVFFGTRHTSWEHLPTLFPKMEFARLKQVHGNRVISADKGQIHEADGHMTRDSNLGITIVTADCLPILLVDAKSKTIAAVHAGWRGIANGIISEVVSRNKFNQAFIGPHIQKSSFEVGADVADKISEGKYSHAISGHSSPQKRYVDLNLIAKEQLISSGLDSSEVYSTDVNTFTDLNYASYRRKEEPVGRQISFIALRVAR